VNFSVYSKNADAVELLLFDNAEDSSPARKILLDRKINKTYHYWHVFVSGITAGQIYGYRIQGPNQPERGLRFDPNKVLLDPYGKAVVIPETIRRRDESRTHIFLEDRTRVRCNEATHFCIQILQRSRS